MVVDIEQIREEEFILFRKAIRKFYKGRQDQYLEGFRERIESGDIDPDDPGYKEFCNNDAKDFMSSRGGEALKFIKSYVDRDLMRSWMQLVLRRVLRERLKYSLKF